MLLVSFLSASRALPASSAIMGYSYACLGVARGLQKRLNQSRDSHALRINATWRIRLNDSYLVVVATSFLWSFSPTFVFLVRCGRISYPSAFRSNDRSRALPQLVPQQRWSYVHITPTQLSWAESRKNRAQFSSISNVTAALFRPVGFWRLN